MVRTKIKTFLNAVLASMTMAICMAPLSVRADQVIYTGQIAVPAYGSSVSAMPWAIAMKKGFFQQQGLNITGIISSAGGSDDVRNLIAGNLIFADSNLIPVLRAIQGGADLKVISENGHTTAQFVWITRPGSPIKTLADLKGKKITFTTPLSTSQFLDSMLVKKAGLAPTDVHLISTGAYGSALTALQNGGVDVALVVEPVYTLNKGRFQVLFWSRDLFPAISSTIGVTSAANAKKQGDVLRRILIAHRQAVDYIESDPKGAAAIIAPIYRMDPAVVEHVLEELSTQTSTDGVSFYSEGDINAKGMDNLANAAEVAGALQGTPDWRSNVDQDFLPADLKRQLN
jgi:NitT/TauT family transport system substrate-binding protein